MLAQEARRSSYRGRETVSSEAYIVLLESSIEDLQRALAAERARREKAEHIMLLYRNGDEKSAQLAYMDYCGKYLGEPSRG